MRNQYRLRPIVSPVDQFDDRDRFFDDQMDGVIVDEQQIQNLLVNLDNANEYQNVQNTFNSLLGANLRLSIEYECGACCIKVHNIARVLIVLGFIIVFPSMGSRLCINGNKDSVAVLAIPLEAVKSLALTPHRYR